MHKKTLSLLAAAALLFSALPAASAVSVPALQGSAACLMDAASGQVLYEKNMNTQLAPASITKIMTVLLGVENGNWSDIVTMSHDAVYSVPRNTSHIALQEGEQLTLEQALMATMLPSANDAANGVAEFVSGSIPAFVEKMNARAAECGAINTHFMNANGLDEMGHLTTAYDMAAITRTAMQNEDFLRVFGTAEYTIPPTNLQVEARNIGAGHKMMFNFTKYYDAGIIGGKSGYTEQAGHTLVSAVQRDGRTLIAVVMGEPKNAAMYEDTVALFDYGFNGFSAVTLAAQSLSQGHELAADNTDYTVWLTDGLTAEDLSLDYAVKQNDATGCVVEVSVSLAAESGLQYARLGSTTLTYKAQEPEMIQAMESAPQNLQTTQKPLVLRVLLTAVRLCVVAVSLTVFGCVFVMFYIRVRYDLRAKNSRARRRK